MISLEGYDDVKYSVYAYDWQKDHVKLLLNEPFPYEGVNLAGYWNVDLIEQMVIAAHRRNKENLDRLKDIQGNPIKDMILGFKPIKTNTAKPLSDYFSSWIPNDLNENQRQALYCIHNQQMTLIQGPPGTGKTTMICYAVLSLLERMKKTGVKKKILVCGDSNQSVNNIATRFLKLLEEKGLRSKYQFVRWMSLHAQTQIDYDKSLKPYVFPVLDRSFKKLDPKKRFLAEISRAHEC